MLPETLVEADGNEETRTGVTSVFDGPAPTFRTFETAEAEAEALVQWLRDRIARDAVPPSEVVILLRHERDLMPLSETFEAEAVRVLPMHDAKGSEYRAVAIAGLSDGNLPDESRILSARDEAQLDEIMNTERHLLYVAATRARDYLWMSGVNPVSEFFSDLLDR